MPAIVCSMDATTGSPCCHSGKINKSLPLNTYHIYSQLSSRVRIPTGHHTEYIVIARFNSRFDDPYSATASTACTQWSIASPIHHSIARPTRACPLLRGKA